MKEKTHDASRGPDKAKKGYLFRFYVYVYMFIYVDTYVDVYVDKLQI